MGDSCQEIILACKVTNYLEIRQYICLIFLEFISRRVLKHLHNHCKPFGYTFV